MPGLAEQPTARELEVLRLLAAGPDTPVEEAAQIMLLNGFRHLPIVEGRRVHGVVSLRDLFSARISRPPQQRSAAS